MHVSSAENGVALEWSPDGQRVLVSTTVPRLRVDNGIKVIRADGCLLGQKAYPVLMQATWRPAAPGTFTDTALDLTLARGGAPGAAVAAPAQPPPPVVTGYVPPHLRNNPAAAAAARAKFSLARDANDRGGKIVSGVTKAPQAPPAAKPLPPGLPPSGTVQSDTISRMNVMQYQPKMRSFHECRRKEQVSGQECKAEGGSSR